jgi:alkylated DNA nucleotide flippase Atl1
MDVERLRAVIEAIPEGRWSSYADVVAAAGGGPRQAIRAERAPDARRPPDRRRAPGAQDGRQHRLDGAR